MSDSTADLDPIVQNPIVRNLGLQSYAPIAERMREFTDNRNSETADEFWVLQHTPVYTLGQAGDSAHILDAGQIDVVQSDRGGQVTYHGPGQIVVYVLVDLRRRNIGVRTLVELMENSVIALLESHNIVAASKRDAPGVYVADKKIAALGLRVRRGCSFHGLSLNVDMDLEPFSRINPCGYSDLAVTQLANENINMAVSEAGRVLTGNLIGTLPAINPGVNKGCERGR